PHPPPPPFPYTTLFRSAAPLKIAAMPLQGGEGVSPAQAEAISEAVASELVRHPDLKVITQSDIAAMLGLERQKQMIGCKEDAARSEEHTSELQSLRHLV